MTFKELKKKVSRNLQADGLVVRGKTINTSFEKKVKESPYLNQQSRKINAIFAMKNTTRKINIHS